MLKQMVFIHKTTKQKQRLSSTNYAMVSRYPYIQDSTGEGKFFGISVFDGTGHIHCRNGNMFHSLGGKVSTIPALLY